MDKASNNHTDTHKQRTWTTYSLNYIGTWTETDEFIADLICVRARWNHCFIQLKVANVMAKSAWGWHSSGARRQPSEMIPWNMTEGVDGISNPGVFPGKKRWSSRGWTTTSLHCLSRPRKVADICHLRQTWFRCRRFSHVGNSTVVFWELLLRLHTVQGCFASVNWQSFTAATCVTLELHGGTSRHQCQILFDSIQAEINHHFKVNWLNFKTLGYLWKTLPAPTDSGVHLIFHHLCMALFSANASQGDIAFLILHF